MFSTHKHGIVKVVPVKRADELLTELAPTSKNFRSDPPYSWIYRGLLSSDYMLVPSALRQGALDRISVKTPHDMRQHVQAEFKIIREFFTFADRRGLPLPEDSQHTRAFLDTLADSFLDHTKRPYWPPTELLSLCGLAQHYGLPTRLLDWTYDPLIAAYFAAGAVMNRIQETAMRSRKAIERYCSSAGLDVSKVAVESSIHGSLNKTMTVWAFNRNFYRDIRMREKFGPRSTDNIDSIPFEIVTIPYATNPNIQAQQGLFTLDRRHESAESIDRRPLDEIVLEYIRKNLPDLYNSPHFEESPIFCRFDLPWKEFDALLVLLAKSGINGSTVFPGYQGVVDAVEEKLWWWDNWNEIRMR